jgi:HEPN superfamily AbiU2-like protein
MNQQQTEQLMKRASRVGNQLRWAWNDYTMLRGLQRHAQQSYDVLNRHPHFICTITVSLWGSLVLNLSFCSDNKSTGSLALLEKLEKWLDKTDEHYLQVIEQKTCLRNLDELKTIIAMRNNLYAHENIT